MAERIGEADMELVIVDTNVISFMIKADTRREKYRRHLDGRQVCISFMTVAELYRWTIERSWGNKRVEGLRAELAKCVVLPYDDEMAWAWARIRSIKGRPMESGDAWIAATAIRHSLPLVTHNRKHFEGVDRLQLISED
jgi:tRNA(fMet)-specific endonuclease VapC